MSIRKSDSIFRRLFKLDAARWACALLFLFVVLFPKGGFKIGDVPITWGYCLIALYALVACPWAILDSKLLRLSPLTLFVFCCLLPFQFILLMSFANGIESMGFALSTLLSFFGLPAVFLILWRQWYGKRLFAFALRALKFCVIAAAIYGISMFFSK